MPKFKCIEIKCILNWSHFVQDSMTAKVVLSFIQVGAQKVVFKYIFGNFLALKQSSRPKALSFLAFIANFHRAKVLIQKDP